MRREKDRQLFLGAEALLNRSLKLVDAPVSLPAVYTRNRYGKPYLDKTSGIYVNWSHSGSFAICALSDREVGIDLQNTFKTPKSALVRRVLQPEEQIYYDQTPKEQRRQLFYSYWTVKESFLKALGNGFRDSDRQFLCKDGRTLSGSHSERGKRCVCMPSAGF